MNFIFIFCINNCVFVCIFFGSQQERLAGFTVLHLAARDGHTEMAEHLLKCSKELDIEAVTYGQLTAYQLAEDWNNTDISKILEVFGCDPIPPPYDSSDEEDDDASIASDDD